MGVSVIVTRDEAEASLGCSFVGPGSGGRAGLGGQAAGGDDAQAREEDYRI